MRVDVVTDERGRRLAVKRADTPEDAARLRREADLLEAATHPGLVELVELGDGPEGRLSTAYLEGGSLDGDRSFDVEEIAGAVAAVASTLADLHGLGLVHGAIAPAHVLLDGDGRPVLCSLGYGGLAGERRPAPPGVPPAFDAPGSDPDEALDPTRDVYAAGALLSGLLSRANGRARGGPTDALRRIAERAMSTVHGDRPTARQLADELHDLVPAARLPGATPFGRSAASPPPDRHRPLETWRTALPAAPPPRRRVRTVALASSVLAVVAVVGTLAVRGSPDGQEQATAEQTRPHPTPVSAHATQPDPAPQPDATLAPTTAVTVAPAVTTATAAIPRPSVPPTVARAGCPEVAGPLAADVDADGCAEAVHFSGGVVEAGGLRWQVGEADDVIAVGDWSCSGSRSLAVLRPGTGEVFAFAGWASADQQLEAPLLARVAGARALRPADLDADGCNELLVERTEGAPAVVRAPRSQP